MTSKDGRTGLAPAGGQSGAAKMFGDFAPGLVAFTDDVLFGQVWTRSELLPRDRSLVTVAALIAAGNTEQLNYHLGLARQNGVTETELIEAITHLAFYAGWPRAMSAMAVARQVFRSTRPESPDENESRGDS
jgi:4-carboxymuconolactone decarboxylase